MKQLPCARQLRAYTLCVFLPGLFGLIAAHPVRGQNTTPAIGSQTATADLPAGQPCGEESQDFADPSPAVGRIQVSRDAVNLFFGQEIVRQTEICVAGQPLGTVDTTGVLSLLLVPNDQRATFDVHAEGKIAMGTDDSNTLQVQWGGTRFNARKRFSFDASQVVTDPAVSDIEPAQARPSASSGGFFKVPLNLTLGELSSRHVSERVCRQLDDEFENAFDGFVQRWREQPWIPVSTVGSLTPAIRCSTSSSMVNVSVMAASNIGLEPPGMPAALEQPLDFRVLVHESLFNAIMEFSLGGRELTDSDILHHVTRMRGSAPWELWVHARRPRWSVTLAKREPLAITFEKGECHIVVRGSQMCVGDELIAEPFVVRATLRPETGEGAHFRRTSDVTIIVGDGNSSSAALEKMANVLHQKFGALFAPAVYFDGLCPPAGGSWDKFRRFQLVDWSAADGWFAVGYRLQP